MHTIWKGSISFGLVNIPIKLHAATEDKDIKLRSLHKKCHTPIKYEKKCPVCEEEITADEIVKGYEIASGKFVILEDAELEQLKKATEEKAVEIIDFMKMEEIDPIYYNRSYYMSPNEGGMKAYGLLRKALVESNKVGLAKIVMRSKEQLAIIRVYQNTLLMETIHFPDEVRNVEEVPNVPAEDQTSEKELDTAILLIDQLTTTFQPEKYTDDYRSKLMEIIDSKRTGQEMVTVAEKKPTNVTDLMAALQASIDRTKPVEEKKTTRKRKATTKTKKA
ncbi:Ku protein [Heyndrickxia ginsengihumi]